MIELKFKLVPAVYDAETKSFKPATELSDDQFYITIYNSKIDCKPEEEIKWFAVLDYVDGKLDLDSVLKLAKDGREAHNIRLIEKQQNKVNEPIE